MLDDQTLQDLANELVRVAGVVGVVLGGSRARGEHTPQSDVDLGLYYRQPLDLPHLRSLAQQVAGPTAQLTDRGGWGQWVDGGGWLRIDDTAVDWIYRDLDRVYADVDMTNLANQLRWQRLLEQLREDLVNLMFAVARSTRRPLEDFGFVHQ